MDWVGLGWWENRQQADTNTQRGRETKKKKVDGNINRPKFAPINRGHIEK
jgi:hypothetical protein